MTVAGIGCRRDVTTAEVLAAIDAALTAHGLSRASLDALATVPSKCDQAALHVAAAALGVPMLVPTGDSISAAAPRTISLSAASHAATGTQSASEAAALAAAGPGTRLLGPRHILGPVTCAIAVSEETS